jgi:predicted RNase H-like HicB family nuclease
MKLTKPAMAHNGAVFAAYLGVRPTLSRGKMGPRGERMRYKVILQRSDEGVAASVPGLPGCHSQGDTEAEALDNIRSAIEEYLAVVEEQTKGSEVREVEVTVS